MGFPSPAMDYQESRLSLDSYCKTGRPGVFLFRSDCTSFREGIRQGSLLIVDFGGTPVDGSLVLCVLEEQFRLMRLRLYPQRCLQELDKLDQIRALPEDDEEGLEIGSNYAHRYGRANRGICGSANTLERKKYINRT
jgi:DNA polymerase V